jgi:hypothetical protein
MDKYTKTLILMIKIPIGILCALLGLGLVGVSIWVSTFSDIASMILLIAFLGGGALINFGIGYAFLGDEYKATNIVRDGNTTFTPNTTDRFLKRRKIVMFIGFIAYLLLSVYYVVRAILVGAYYGYLQDIDFNTNIVAVIIFAVISLFLSIVFFLLYKKTKHIDLNEA